MAELLAGQVTAFFLFDVAEGVQLSTLRSILGASAESPRLAVKPAVPAYVQYQEPPVQVDADTLGLAVRDGAQARFKVYDYGVISLALTRAFRGSWSELHAVAQATASATLESEAERLCRQVICCEIRLSPRGFTASSRTWPGAEWGCRRRWPARC